MTKTKHLSLFSGLLLAALGVTTSFAQTGAVKSFAAREASPGVWQVGTITPRAITESSGVIPCRGNTNAFWTHNDGRRRNLYALTRTGERIAEFIVPVTLLEDWEDIARDDAGNLYLADIGNNEGRRTRLAVHQFVEPDLQKPTAPITLTRSWQLTFPGKPFDCESLFIWQDHGYVISKVSKDEAAEIYRFPLALTTAPVPLEFVAKLPMTSPVTSADISPDGQRLALVCKNGVYWFQIDGEVSRAATASSHQVKFREGQIEGICFVPDGLLATSEKREIFLFTPEAFRGKSK